MAGSLSSLGLGSGTLTSDVIDKLKEADKSILVTPVEKKIDDNKSKTAELSTLTTLLATLKTTTSTLSDDTTYLNRTTSVRGDSVTATATAGVSIQDIDVAVNRLAKQSIFESSTTFATMDENILSSGTNSTFSFYVGDSKTTISLGDGAVSLSKLVEEINDQAGDKVTASIMNVGGDTPYKLILKSKETGADNQIYFSQNSLDGALFSTLDGGVVGSNDLKAGMTINGVSIVDSDTNYASINELVNAINAKTGETKVKAIESAGQIILQGVDGGVIDLEDTNATPGDDWANLGFTINVGSAEVDGSSLKSGMTINGVSLVDTDKTYSSIDELISTINEKMDETNVKAFINDGGTISLKSLDGSAIDIEDGNGGADWSKLGFFVNVGSSEASSVGDIGDDKSKSIINALGINMLQKAQDAEFTFNGVNVTRTKNTVDDLIVGLTLELQQVDTSGSNSTIRIKRDDSGIVDTISEMVAAYNQVLNKLSEVTDYKEDTGEAGIFQGESTVTRIKSNLNRILLTSDFTQDIHNLIESGIKLNDSGLLTFEEATLQSKLSEDPEAVEKLFLGFTSSVNGQDVEFEGIFAKMNSELEGLIGDSGSLTLFDENLKSNKTKLEEERDKAIERIDVRYETMASKFAAYDSMISSMNAGFQSLQMQIDAMVSSKN